MRIYSLVCWNFYLCVTFASMYAYCMAELAGKYFDAVTFYSVECTMWLDSSLRESMKLKVHAASIRDDVNAKEIQFKWFSVIKIHIYTWISSTFSKIFGSHSHCADLSFSSKYQQLNHISSVVFFFFLVSVSISCFKFCWNDLMSERNLSGDILCSWANVVPLYIALWIA